MADRDPWNPYPGDPTKRPRRRDFLRDDLGLPLPERDDDRNAPPVEPQAIRAVLDRTATPEEDRRVSWLIFRYQAWARAYVRAALEAKGGARG